ncbi:MAG: type II toxin-antitoxin system HicA family toxin [Alphaproteobacteria bacterium]|nr:type II toxin-antitoxin system HicA family toxin [Alphaproteobacteria bacterium]
MSDTADARTAEFLLRAKRIAAARGLEFALVAERGKGGRRCIVAMHGSRHEIPPGTLRAMLRQLGIDPASFRRGE